MGLRAAALPEGFIEQDFGTGWNEAVGLAFGKNGNGLNDRVYVWERGGRVWIVENGIKLDTPLLDISEEVGAWLDLGMLGFALDPNFQSNGHFYVLYVVDRHHLMTFGTAAYRATANGYYEATIGRLTRYTAKRSDDFRTADPASRKILIGESVSTGFPILSPTHGTGSIVFGADGTLLAACGDGASPEAMDDGGTAGDAYGPQAVADGIITVAEDIGAFRCQSLDSLSGKIVRIDPSTGDGIPSNPHFQADSPRSPRSRAWSLGLRNPMRMALKPGTGEADPAAGAPGVLAVGDVGWLAAEDLEVVDRPGQNFGWPLYEGFDRNTSYWNARPAGVEASDAVKPRSSWRGSASFLATDGSVQRFGAANATVPGADFSGNCSIGGVWYTGTDFPPEWQNVYFHADYGGGWIRAFSMDENHFLTGQRPFLSGAAITCVATDPETGGLYYVDWAGGVKKISYAPAGNRAPTAVATVSETSGTSPLTVRFSGLGSHDPESGTLSYGWDFGDGTTSGEPHPIKTFTADGAKAFTAMLTVRDADGAAASASVLITVNNLAPTVTITSPAPGATFPIAGAEVTVPLTAAVSSSGHDASLLSYRWQTFLYHNSHFHSEPEQTTASASMVQTPLAPSATDFYYYKIVLTVTDPLGARTTAERLILPDGSLPEAPPFAVLGVPPPVVGAAFSIPVMFNESVSGLTTSDFALTNGAVTALSGTGAVYSLTVTPEASGPVTVSLPAGACVDAENLANVTAQPVSTFFLAPPEPPPPPSGPGLKGDYFTGENFGTLALTRIDPRLDFYWPETTSPGPGVPGDYFSTRWTGRITPPTSGSWQFFADVDDGLRLWVNGELLLDQWNPPPAVYWGLASSTITLTAGVAYDFKVEYQDFFSDSYLVLRWAGPGTPQQGVPDSAFSQPPSGPDVTAPEVTLSAPSPATGPFTATAVFTEPVSGLTTSDFVVTNGVAGSVTGSGAAYAVTITPGSTGPITVRLPASAVVDAANNPSLASNLLEIAFTEAPPPPPPPPTSGPGLKGEYFSGENFGTPALTRIDPRLEFYWPETTSPGPGVPGDYFSTRWTGRLTPPTSGSWQFFADVDDGLRLWVNGQLLLDQWNPPPAVYWGLASSTITLTAGVAYDFKVEYQDFFSDSYLVLRWAGPGIPQQGVPDSAFSQPPSGPDLTPPGVTLAAASSVTAAFPVTAAFTEPVSGLTASDFAVTNGTASALTGTGAAYTVTVTPGTTGPVTVRLPAAAAADAAANPSLASNLLEVAYTAPAQNRPPVLANPGPQSAERGAAVALALAASDPDGNSLAFAATGLPAGVTVNATTGTLAGTVTAAAGAYASTLTVTDGFLSASIDVTWTITEPPPASGPGLKGEYFSGENFGTPALTRIDPRLEFYWPETTSPGPGVPGDYFSTRWTGRLTAPTSGSWQFFADVDDGLRLWVNGELLLDQWNPPPAVYWGLTSSTITLTAGVAYDFKVEYQDFFSDSYLVLRWAGPGTPQQGVPNSAFSLTPDSGLTTISTTAFSTTDTSATTFLLARADLHPLEQTLAVMPQPDGTVELQFTRHSGRRLALVLQVSEDMTNWKDIHDPGWSTTPLPDAMELVQVPRACCLLVGQPETHAYFRVRAGP